MTCEAPAMTRPRARPVAAGMIAIGLALAAGGQATAREPELEPALMDALQHLVAKKLARGRDDRGKAVVVDAGGYRKKHVEWLEGLAARMADKCRSSSSPVPLNPMSAYDRRIVHMALAEDDDVKTESDGEGEDRHVVVYPV